MRKKLLCILMSCVMVLSFMPTLTFADTAVTDNPNVNTIAFTSDAHNMLSNNSGERLSKWIVYACKGENDKLDIMCGLGDYGSYQSYAADYWKETGNVINAINDSEYVKNDGMFISGNHDWLNGFLRLSTNKVADKLETKTGRIFSGGNYEIYSFGATSTFEVFDNDDISKLGTYLNNVDSAKTIFIISHYPLHKTDERTITNSAKVVKAINDNAEGKNIVFLWGHNHTDAHSCEHNYDQVFTDTIPSVGGDISIKFTYASAGCMADEDYSAGAGAGRVRGKGLVATINNTTGEVTLKYYDKDGVDFYHEIIKQGVTPTPVNPVNPGPVGPVAPTEPDKPGSEHEHNYVYTVIAEPGLLTNGVAGYICECGEALKYIDLPGYSESHLKSLKIKKSKNGFTVKWKKQSKKNQKEFSGYQIAYSTKKSMKNAKYVYAKKAASSKLIKAAKKQYYVKVRTYKTVDGCRFYADWSKVKIVKK